MEDFGIFLPRSATKLHFPRSLSILYADLLLNPHHFENRDEVEDLHGRRIIAPDGALGFFIHTRSTLIRWNYGQRYQLPLHWFSRKFSTQQAQELVPR